MSDNTKQKKVIRARQQATGETYSTARLHVLRALPDREPPAEPPAPPPPATGFAATVERVIELATAAAGRSGDDVVPAHELRPYLVKLPPADLRKLAVLMYAGRAGEGLRDVAGELARSTPAETVALIAGKLTVLAQYLRQGLMVAEHEHVALDADWTRKNPGRWAREPGSAYDRAIDGMHAWEARYAPQPDEVRDSQAKKAWAEREGVTMSMDGHACLLRLTHENGGDRHAGRCVHLPGSDHTSVWMKAGKPHIYVTQPYELDDERLDEMFRVCRRHGLTLRVDSAVGWHNPMAVLIEVLRGEA